MTTERRIKETLRGGPIHWVGDGFRVTNYFPSGNGLGFAISPFLLMDYHPAHHYEPTDNARRGVGPHPHRGFETVTLAYEGSVAHHDSMGNGGVIGPGDVQWMTAASGILHREYHEREFARAGGNLHMVQLWVNLPRAHKMAPPRYQGLKAEQMGQVELPEGAGLVRVIAGEFQGIPGPAETFSPIDLFDVRLNPGGRVDFSFAAHQNTALLILSGRVTINGKAEAEAQDLVLFKNEAGAIQVEAPQGAQLLLLNGDPIQEPVIQYGPFVMNTKQEILTAFQDFEAGRFGSLDD